MSPVGVVVDKRCLEQILEMGYLGSFSLFNRNTTNNKLLFVIGLGFSFGLRFPLCILSLSCVIDVDVTQPSTLSNELYHDP